MGLKRFDYTINDNKKKHVIIGVSIVVLVLLVGVTIYATFAKYKETKTYNILQGKVSEFIAPDVSLTIKLVDAEGNETIATEFPSLDEYTYDEAKSNCVNGGIITFDTDNALATISASGKDKCTIYFNIK